MKILVPLKRVVDYNVKVRPLPDNTNVDLNNVKMSVNPFCEIALEEAVRIKEAGNADEVIAITVGKSESQEQLRTALALGADRAILVETEVEAEPLGISKLLKSIVDKESPDLIILGKQAIDGDNNQTGQMLGALTGFSQATFASEVNLEGDSLSVTREIDGGLQTLKDSRKGGFSSSSYTSSDCFSLSIIKFLKRNDQHCVFFQEKKLFQILSKPISAGSSIQILSHVFGITLQLTII